MTNKNRIALISEYLHVRYKKLIVVRKQEYANAAALRDAECQLLLKINETFGDDAVEIRSVEVKGRKRLDYKSIETMIDNYIDSILGYSVDNDLTGDDSLESNFKRAEDFMAKFRDFKLTLILSDGTNNED